MIRRLFAIGSAILLGPCVAVLLIWPGSHWRMLAVTASSNTCNYRLEFSKGEVRLSRIEPLNSPSGRLRLSALPPGELFRIGPTPTFFESLGFGWYRGAVRIGLPGARPRPFAFVAFPIWFFVMFVVVPTMLLTAAWLQLHRRHRRVQQGLCLQCGYDLRASMERCPECGSPVRQKSEVAA